MGECQGLGRGEGDGHIIDTTPHPHLRLSRVRIQEPPDFIDCVHNSGDCNTLPEDFYGVLKHKLSKNVPKCSKLKIKVEQGTFLFNPDKDPNYYREDDIDYMINMLRFNVKDFSTLPLYDSVMCS